MDLICIASRLPEKENYFSNIDDLINIKVRTLAISKFMSFFVIETMQGELVQG